MSIKTEQVRSKLAGVIKICEFCGSDSSKTTLKCNVAGTGIDQADVSTDIMGLGVSEPLYVLSEIK